VYEPWFSLFRFSLASIGQFFQVGRMESIGILIEGSGHGKAFPKE
jgi:hypothetical protein